MRFIEVNKHFCHKSLYCLHSLLREDLRYSQRLVKIKLYFFPIQVHGPQVEND